MAHLTQVKYTQSDWRKIDSDVVAVCIFDNLRLSRQLQSVNRSLGRTLTNAIASGMISGKEAEVVDLSGKKGFRAFAVGLGKRDQFSTETLRKAGAAVTKAAIEKKLARITFLVPKEGKQASFSQALSEGLVLGSYQFVEFKSEEEDSEKNPFLLQSAVIVGGDKKGIEKGVINSQAVCFARDLGNRPGNVVTPSYLANQAENIGKTDGMKVTVFSRPDFEKMKLCALAGVASGSGEEPKFIVMEYWGTDKSQKPKVLVGKGLTFDSGGISIKPSAKMDEMKYDMCGSAIVLAVMKVVATVKPEINIVGIIPSTENLSGSKAYKPGDILTAYNGKTIEVLNTDAEGRIILADALSYSCKHYEPEYILDFATLTGAVVIALGHVATGILGTDQKLLAAVKESSRNTGEKVWELPLWDEYLEQVKSQIADVKNTGARGEAGTIAGAAFLKAFVNNGIPWVHFDIAGTAWGSRNLPYHSKGSATGEVIRLVLDLIKV
ncbi:MAG: leucyl aminopeptidase [Fidelibacterota bacterium]